MGLCSVAGMLELQETLDFLIFQVLSLIIGSTLKDSPSPRKSGRFQNVQRTLILNVKPIMNLENFSNVKNENF